MIDSKPHTNCRACGTRLPAPILDLGAQPLANNLCTDEQHNDDVLPLRMARCEDCGLLQLDAVVNPAAMFGHYLYTPSQSKTTLAHFEALATSISIRLPMIDQLAVDIGSNDGALLGFLAARTWRAVGIDPAENLVAAANAAGRKTVLGFLNDTTVDEVLRDHGEAMLVTANNVFAHTPDWSRFVACVDRLLAPGGRCAIEFPYGPTMLRDGFFDISYFEHYSYPALGPVQRLLAPRGFSIIDVEEMPAVHGGSVRLWIGRETDTRWTPSPRVARMISEEQARTYSPSAAARFAFRAMLARERFCDAVRAAGKVRRVIGYTAPAKAVTLIEFCGLGASDIACIIDDNPLKQGKMLPVSHIPIVGSGLAAGDAVVIFAWNVAEDIMARLPRGVDVIIPMPVVCTVRR